MGSLAVRRGEVPVARRVAAVVVPVLIAAAAYGLWWLSDRAQYVGPLDRAGSFWVFVAPVWLAGPVVAGWTWRRLTGRQTALAAAAVMATVGAVAAWLFWAAVSFPDCVPVRTPPEWIVPSLVVGTLVAGGLVASAALARLSFSEGRVVQGVIAGALAEAGLSFLAIAVIGVAFLAGPGCQRPSG